MATHSLTGRHAPVVGSAAEAEHFRANGFTPAPRFIQWMATLRCDLHCPHCLADDGRPPAPDMPLAAVERLLDEVAAMGVAEFLVTGGEPAARPDLPEVVAMLGERGLRWTLNTAVMPGERLRAAVERHPPAFVAVSLDGPERVHDAFRGRAGAHRGALEAIRYYLSVVPGRLVTAGTTVTARNFRHLSETFFEVVASGASGWGLHLLVPEGRAGRDRRLFLSRRQLRGLVDFSAARRGYYPVGMADEIGYLGEEEPLVRDEPFFCGAGRTQCVVLPGGEVVPCTTLDRRTSVGSIMERPLAEIWAEGFAALRHWQPEGRCRSCEYAPACRGGCWLQRRHGTQCFRPVWRAPRLVGAAAAAVCFGLGSAAAGAEPPAEAPRPAAAPEPGAEAAEEIERYIVGWYTAQYPGRDRGDLGWSRDALDGRPAAKTAAGAYAIAFVSGRKETGLAARCKAVRDGLKDGPVPLSLASLMWRDLCEAALDDAAATPRTDGTLRQAMTELSARAEETRAKAIGPTLEAFASGRYGPGWGEVSKAGPTRSQALARQLDSGRWAWKYAGRTPDGKGYTVAVGEKGLGRTEEAIREYLRAYPFGHSLTVRAECRPEDGLVILRGGREEKAAGKFELRICDFLKVPERLPESGVALTLGGEPGALRVNAKLPAGAELSYPDVLRLAWEQNRKALLELARGGSSAGLWRSPPLLLPALRELAGQVPEVPAEALAARLKALVAELGAKEFEKREAASVALVAMGKPALAALREAAASRDAEVADRARRAIAEIEAAADTAGARRRLVDLWLF